MPSVIEPNQRQNRKSAAPRKSNAAAAPRTRFTARIPEGMHGTLQEAAELVGATVNQFVVQIAFQEAQRLLERESVLRLSREDARRVFELMEKPPKATKKLKDAVKEFKKTVRA